MGQTSDFSEVGEYWPKERTQFEEALLDQYTSRKFHDLMDNRMMVSHYKYGDSRLAYPEKVNALKSLRERLALYLETGNAEWLVDVANMAMLEFMHPSLPNAHFSAKDSDASPGLPRHDGSRQHGKHE